MDRREIRTLMCLARILIFSSSSSLFSALLVDDDADGRGSGVLSLSAAAEAACRPTSVAVELVDRARHLPESADDLGSPPRRVSVADNDKTPLPRPSASSSTSNAEKSEEELETVSYTHLTLPTILRV